MIQAALEPLRENPKQIHATKPPPSEGCIDTQGVGNGRLIGINRPAKRNGRYERPFRDMRMTHAALRSGVFILAYT